LSNHAPAAAAADIARERTMIAPVQALVEQVQAFMEQQVDPDPLAHQRIAVLVPCYNEEAAIAKVVADFRAALPTADIYVYDNNSRDRTVADPAGQGAGGAPHVR
jgi:hypothetical protein